MISSTFTTFFLTLFALFTLGASVPISPRDVFVPPVLYPNAATVWKVGNHHNVTWYVVSSVLSSKVTHPIYHRNVTDAPEHITNPVGQIYLAKAGIINLGMSRSVEEFPSPLTTMSYLLDDPLAKGFNITNGRQEIKVPDVTPGSDYTIVRE